MLNLCQLNSLGNTLKVEFNFGAWQILFKKTFDLNIFLSHMKYGRKTIICLRVIFALVMAAMVVGQATGRVPDFAKAQLATKSLLDLFNLIPKIDNLDESGLQSWNSNEEQTEEGVVHIEFKDIHFRYPSRPDAKVMSGFSLKVMKGKTVAFVGPSGCGKSTVMQLIQRFYDPEQGSVVSCFSA